MTLYQKVNMKDLLAEGLFLLMKEKSFEKITIKQICDKTGVIRGTFYHHFIDKYEALEYLVNNLFYDDIIEIEKNDDKLKKIFEIVYEYQDFFIKGFKIEGQNSFESILQSMFRNLFINAFDNDTWKHLENVIPKDFFISYYTHAIVYIIKYWADENFQQTPHDIYQMTFILFTKSMNEML